MNRVAVVTGGYSGIGLETTRALADAGATVVVPARRPEAAASALADIDRTEVDQLDLGDLESVERFASRFVVNTGSTARQHSLRAHHPPPAVAVVCGDRQSNFKSA